MPNEFIKSLSKAKSQVMIGHRDEPYEEIKECIKGGVMYHIKSSLHKDSAELGIKAYK